MILRRVPKATKVVLSLVLVMSATPTGAYADTSSDLASSETQLEEKRGELERTQAEIERLQAEIDAKAEHIFQSQRQYQTVATELSSLIRSNYKAMQPSMSHSVEAIMESRTVDEIMTRTRYDEAMTARMSSLATSVRAASETLDREYSEISASKDAQEQLRAKLDEEIPQIEAQVDSLRNQLEEERQEERQQDLEPSPASDEDSVPEPEAETFATGSTDGWRTGVASAYGGWSDPSTGAVCSTATGAICNDWSMGVAVPMAWPDYRSYFNRTIEISYNGQSVIATVNDCGYMGAGSRSLDLQPGVFKAFGFSTCDAWGLRTVSYRFL